MKYFTTLFLIGFVVLSNSLFAQMSFTPYLASEQLEKAKEEVIKKYTDPQLITVATLNGILTLPGLGDIPIAFTTENGDDKGKSSAWVYVFRSTAAPENIQAIVVAVTPFSTMPVNLSDMGIPLDFITKYVSNNNLENKSWINSNSVVDALTGSSQYKAFLASYPNAVPKYLNIGYANYPPLDANTPYWFVQVNAAETDSTIIIINGLNGSIVGVDDDSQLNRTIANYPNPANDFISFSIPNELIGKNIEVKLWDNNGSLLFENNMIINDVYTLDTKKLYSGNYNITFSNGITKTNSTFIINK
jgi:hypothetical protein